jgi:DNA-binding NtrC family response regulator
MAERILIVDDDKGMLKMLELFLTSEGYRVDTARGVDEALESIAFNQYRIMLFDKNMPGTDGNREGGIELLRHVHARSLPSPVIMMTGNPTVASSFEAMKLGAVDLVCKPFSLLDLRRMIKKIIQ